MRPHFNYWICLLAAGAVASHAATWEKLSLWIDPLVTIPPRDCELTPDNSAIWVSMTGDSPSKILLASPSTEIYAPLSSFYSVSGQYPIGLAVNSSGEAYVGGHLGKVWKGTADQFTPVASLPHGRTVNDLSFDVYGRLWAATDSLAWRFDGAAWSPAGVAADYGSSPKTTHLAADPRGGMWIGSNGKGLLLHKQGAFTKQFDLAVRQLQVMPSGTVLVGRWDKAARIAYGAASFEVVDHVTNNPDVTDGATNGAFEDATGNLWIGNGGGIALRNASGTWSTWVQPLATGETGSLFYRFLQAGDGTLYACGDYASYRYSEKVALPTWPTPDSEFAAGSSSSAGGSSSSGNGSSSSATAVLAQSVRQGYEMRAAQGGIALHVESGSVRLAVYSTAGMPVRAAATYAAGGHIVNLADLPRGLYFARASKNGATSTVPVVVE